jgi:hypothetical protein
VFNRNPRILILLSKAIRAELGGFNSRDIVCYDMVAKET